MKRTLSVLVSNRPRVLVRVSGLFSRRGFNIHSLTVGVTENPDISRMTLVVEGDERDLEQVSKQLQKLVDVIKVVNLDPDESVGRELALIKVNADSDTRGEVLQIVSIFRASVIDIGVKNLMVMITGDEDKIDAICDLLRRFGIQELVRTGKISLMRGVKTIQGNDKSG